MYHDKEGRLPKRLIALKLSTTLAFVFCVRACAQGKNFLLLFRFPVRV